MLSLKRQQKEAIGLLQIGTFLEYFDLMLYVHMAVLLNELFFPKTDSHTEALLTAFAFCSTYVLRPFGALLFGYIGDHIGRKHTVIITTMITSVSCVVMANLPTYSQIGITAAWILTICRIVQGLSSMGEIIGTIIYITEITKPPVQYVATSCIVLSSMAGGIVALGISCLVTKIELDWRLAFWVGAGIAVIGSVARMRLRETPEFLNSKKLSQKSTISMSAKAFLAYFLVYCGWPLSFYLGFIYFNPILKNQFGYSVEDIILHNFYLALIPFVAYSLWTALSYRVHPIIILRAKSYVFLILSCFLPFYINHFTHHLQVFLIQACLLSVSLATAPAESIFITCLPVLQRFTTAGFAFALSRVVMYITTSFSLVYLTEWFGYYGLWIIMLPTTIAFLWGVSYFEKFDRIKN